jgi:uncharacterized delta-60 repeat protein
MINTQPLFSGVQQHTTDIGGDFEVGYKIALQSDGSIVVAGASGPSSATANFAVVRYLSSGGLDPSFGGVGQVVTPVLIGLDEGRSVAIGKDGAIWVAGYAFNGNNSDFAVVNYTSIGVHTRTLTTAFGNQNDRAYCIAVQSNGQVVIAGEWNDYSGSGFGLTRYNSNGTLDSGFGSNGKVTTVVWSGGGSGGRDVDLQSDGKILVAGSTSIGPAVVRYTTSGFVDTSFGTNGIAYAANTYFSRCNALAVQSDGKILVAGRQNLDFAIARLNSNGTVDTGFGIDGKVFTDMLGGLDEIYDLAVQADGKIVVAGTAATGTGTTTQIVMARYNADGSVDTGFGNQGKVIGPQGKGHSLAIQPDGKILVSGSTNSDFVLLRYDGNGVLDQAFDTASPFHLENGSPVILEPNIQISDLELNAAGTYSGASLTLGRQSGANAEDVFVAGSAVLAALAQGASLTISGISIGSIAQNGDGQLIVNFNAIATQSLINQALQAIAYQNRSDAPPRSVVLEWRFSDGNSGSQGTGGALDAFTTTEVNLVGINDAPILLPAAPSLTSLNEDQTANTGQTVASFMDKTAIDADAGALKGIAIFGVEGALGRWQYSFNGSTWTDMGAVSASSALLLRATDWVRWLPNGTDGTSAKLSYYAWDQTTGTVGAGSKAAVTVRGGTSAFSTDSDVATVEVTSINDSPVFLSGDGKTTTAIGAGNDAAYDVSVQADGKIILAGTTRIGTWDAFALTRYQADGSLDTTFGTAGKLTTQIGGSNGTWNSAGYTILIQADEKVIVVGNAANAVAIARYTNSGVLDNAFTSDGLVFGAYEPISGITFSAYGAALQPDGKIVTVGNANVSGSPDFAIARFNTNGTPDTSFSSDGLVTTNIGFDNARLSFDVGRDVVIQTDGKILAYGQSTNGSALVRYTPSGSLDTSFAGDGILESLAVSFGGSSSINGYGKIALQADGKILVAGGSYSYYEGRGEYTDFVVVRYNSDGTLDTTFSLDGIAGIDFIYDGRSYDFVNSIAVQSDGRIVLGGYSYNGVVNKVAVARLNADGSNDLSFGTNGRATAAVGSGVDIGHSITLQRDGKILVAASSNAGTNDDFALLRFNSDGTLDTGFDGSLTASQTFAERVTGVFTEQGNALVLNPDLTVFDLELSANGNYGGAKVSLSRSGGASTEDLFVSGAAHLGPLVEESNLTVFDTVIGTVAENSAGRLTLAFSSNATQALVNQALQAIAYRNSSDAPPSTVVIDWTFSDGNSGAQGAGGAASITGSSTIHTWAINDSPVLTPANPILTSLTESDANNAGQTVASIVGDSITDPDANPLSGIAVYSTTGSKGAWQYSLTGGATWIDLSSVSVTSALLLRSTDLVRWVPAGAAEQVNLSFYGWDQTRGTTAGNKVNVSLRGEYLPYSLSSDTASLSVSRKVNTPPVARDNSYDITEDVTQLLGNLITDGWEPGTTGRTLFRDTDADGDALSISAVTFGGLLTAWADLPNSTDPVDLTDAQAGQPWKTLTLLNGTAWLNANGELRYAGNAHETLGDTLGYTITDGQGGSASAQVQIKVLAVDDPTSATLSVSGIAKTGGSLSLGVSNITDPDGTPSLAYQWQWLNNQTWQNIEGATSNTWAIPTGGLWADRAVRAQLSTTDPLGGKSVFHSDAQTIEASSQLVLSAAHWKSGKVLPGVGVGLYDGATELKTGSDGTLSAEGFQDPDSVDDGQTVLNPSLAINPKQASITLTDVLGALKVYLGKPLPEAYNNDLKFIAADFDGNGTVNLTDVLGLLKFYLNKPVNAAPAWVFVDSAQTTTANGQTLHWSSKANQTLSTTASAPSPILADLNSDESVQLLGVLRGDVDGSWVG